jgi:CrcB protein
MTLPAALFFALGSLAGGFGRWALAGAVQRGAGGALPWGILAVNVLGCLLVGFLDGLDGRLSPAARLALVSGFCGAFTTFSALMLDASRMWRGEPGRALLYVLLSAAGGFLCVRAGAAAAGRL